MSQEIDTDTDSDSNSNNKCTTTNKKILTKNDIMKRIREETKLFIVIAVFGIAIICGGILCICYLPATSKIHFFVIPAVILLFFILLPLFLEIKNRYNAMNIRKNNFMLQEDCIIDKYVSKEKTEQNMLYHHYIIGYIFDKLPNIKRKDYYTSKIGDTIYVALLNSKCINIFSSSGYTISEELQKYIIPLTKEEKKEVEEAIKLKIQNNQSKCQFNANITQRNKTENTKQLKASDINEKYLYILYNTEKLRRTKN